MTSPNRLRPAKLDRYRMPTWRRLLHIAARVAAIGWLVGFGIVAVLAIFATPAAADNCSTFSDCFRQSEAASEAALGLTALAALSLIVDFIGGRGLLGVGHNPFGGGDPNVWERSLGMLSPTPSKEALRLLGVEVSTSTFSSGGGPFGALFKHIPGLGAFNTAGQVDDWARQALGANAANGASAIESFFGRDLFDGQEWSNFLGTVADGSLEIQSLNPGSPVNWYTTLTDRNEMNRRYRSYGVGLWDGVMGIATLAHDVSTLTPGNPASVMELHRWNETGEHRGVILVDNLLNIAEPLSTLNPTSPQGISELAEVWETRSIADHDGLNAGGAMIVGIVDWETFSKDPSQWAGRMTVEGLVEIATAAVPVGISDNLARSAAEVVETGAEAASKADNFIGTPDPPPPPSPDASKPPTGNATAGDSKGTSGSNQDDAANIAELPELAPIDFDGHIMSAEIKPNGKVVGGHSTAAGNVRVSSITKQPDANGVYEAKIEVPDPHNPGQWLPKSNNKGVSTMFPDSWSPDRVKFEVSEAFRNKDVKGDEWTGTTPSGVKVRGFLNPKTTVFPRHKG